MQQGLSSINIASFAKAGASIVAGGWCCPGRGCWLVTCLCNNSGQRICNLLSVVVAARRACDYTLQPTLLMVRRQVTPLMVMTWLRKPAPALLARTRAQRLATAPLTRTWARRKAMALPARTWDGKAGHRAAGEDVGVEAGRGACGGFAECPAEAHPQRAGPRVRGEGRGPGQGPQRCW